MIILRKRIHRQLSDTKVYTKLPSDLTSVNAKIINETINKFVKENLLAKNLGKSLINEEPKTPKFYLNPKVHKENNPGINRRTFSTHFKICIFSPTTNSPIHSIVR